jgi:hypothetical protein
MTLQTIRLELARTPQFPDGSHAHGYEFTAPIRPDGHLDQKAWQEVRQLCTVWRFWAGEDDERGLLLHTRGGSWVFSYAAGDADDEPIFKFDRHVFRVGEYVTITEHDGVARTFKVTSLRPARVTPR